MLVLAGGDLVLPDRILSGASLAIDGARIVAIEEKTRIDSPAMSWIAITSKGIGRILAPPHRYRRGAAA